MSSDDNRIPRRTAEMTLQIAVEPGLRSSAPRGARRASLVVIGGMDLGDTILLREDAPTVLGRDSSCDGILRDDGVSRMHARISHDGSGFVLEDLRSTNGVFVGGERVGRHVLKDGDKVLIGRHTVLKFVLQDDLDLAFQQQMWESSVRDGLTGAYNRRHFDERLAAEVSFARRHSNALTLAMIDLDHFKKVNDTWGHQAGDLVLKSVGATLLQSLRREDVFARYGGEEFAVIARGIAAAGGLGLGERLRLEIERIVIRVPAGDRIPITASVGVCTAPADAKPTTDALVRQADANLYEAKASGRNRVVATELR